MDCAEIKKTIDEQFELKDKKHLNHIASCQICSKYYAASLKIQTLFSKYSCELDDQNGDDFDNALFIKLQKGSAAHQKKTTRTSILQIAFSLVFAITILSGIIYFSFQPPIPQNIVSSTETELNAPIRIILEYTADTDISEVEIDFFLDKGIRFYSENESIKELNTFVWKGDLKKGVNQIPFVVSVTENGLWNILTQARFEGMKHQHKIEFRTNEEKIAVTLIKLESVPDKI